jgi:hypothetical protein
MMAQAVEMVVLAAPDLGIMVAGVVEEQAGTRAQVVLGVLQTAVQIIPARQVLVVAAEVEALTDLMAVAAVVA